MPKEELRSRLGLGGQIFGRVVSKLVEEGCDSWKRGRW